MPDNSASPREGGSVPQSSAGITVSPSPLNAVKLELAAVLVVALTLYALVEILLETGWLQVAILAGYALAAGIWLVVRVRKVVGAVRRRDSGAVS